MNNSLLLVGLALHFLHTVLCLNTVDGPRAPHLPYHLPGAYNLVADKLDPKVLEMELQGDVAPQAGANVLQMDASEAQNQNEPMGPPTDMNGRSNVGLESLLEAVGSRRPLQQLQQQQMPVCWCCRAYVCHYQRCPCSKFML